MEMGERLKIGVFGRWRQVGSLVAEQGFFFELIWPIIAASGSKSLTPFTIYLAKGQDAGLASAASELIMPWPSLHSFEK